jgi:hypothetical protein
VREMDAYIFCADCPDISVSIMREVAATKHFSQEIRARRREIAKISLLPGNYSRDRNAIDGRTFAREATAGLRVRSAALPAFQNGLRSVPFATNTDVAGPRRLASPSTRSRPLTEGSIQREDA